MKFLINPLLFASFMFFSLVLHAQQFKIPTIKKGVLLELQDTNKALLLTRVATPSTTIGSDSYRGMLLFDSSVNRLAYYNATKWVYPITDTPAAKNIYVLSGTLTANRQVDLGGFTLSFKEGNDSLYVKGGKVGVSVNPISALHVKGAVRTDSLVLTSKTLYKAFNKEADSVAIIDSIGRVMKAGLNDLAAYTPTNILSWYPTIQVGASLVPNKLVGGELATYAAFSTFTNLLATAISNYVPAKDSVTIIIDVYPTALTTSTDKISLVLYEYIDLTSAPAATTTLVNFVSGSNIANGMVASKWNKNLSYSKKLNSNTVYVKLGYQITGNSVGSGNGFKNANILSYGSASTAPFVNGGNSTGGVIGTGDASALSFVTNSTNRMFISAAGNIGIGNNAPAYKLDVSGEVRVSSTVFTAKVQGASDVRLKKDIAPIQDALSKVMQLQGVTYTWRKDMEKQAGYTFREGSDYGLIAQEVQKVLPELVQKDKNGFFTVDYPHIVPVLIEAIKEQKKDIETLSVKVPQVEIDSLTTKMQGIDLDMLKKKVQDVEQLKTEMAQLKAMVQPQLQKIKK